ncbi:uncharacterized, partial [Tachysurus ichikawai]
GRLLPRPQPPRTPRQQADNELISSVSTNSTIDSFEYIQYRCSD